MAYEVCAKFGMNCFGAKAGNRTTAKRFAEF